MYCYTEIRYLFLPLDLKIIGVDISKPTKTLMKAVKRRIFQTRPFANDAYFTNGLNFKADL